MMSIEGIQTIRSSGHGKTARCCFAAWVVLGGLLCSASPLLADQESLIVNPPFKTVDRGDSRTPTEPIATQGSLNERFQLSGYFDTGTEVKFSIQDQRNSKPHWVSIGESMDGIRVEAWDADKPGVVLSENGKREMLVLKEVKRGTINRAIAPMFNPVPPKAPTTYPSPPPSLPKPTQLMEKLRREQARQADRESQNNNTRQIPN